MFLMSWIALFHVIARVFVLSVAAEQSFVSRIQTQLRNVILVHHDQPLVPVLHESYVRLDQSRLDLVVAQPGSWIECSDVLERLVDRFDGTGERLSYFFVLLVLQST